MAAAILGGHLVRQPVTVREALARSRMVFWRVIVGSIILGVPVFIAQTALDAVLASALGSQTDVSLVVVGRGGRASSAPRWPTC